MRAIVIGGSIAGLSSALFLARDGWDVTVLEADDTVAPDAMDAETLWFRKGTPHSNQAHAFLAGAVKVLSQRALDVLTYIESNGAIRRSKEVFKPPGMPFVDGEDDLVVLNARRPMVEWFIRKAALEQKGVTFRTGAHVAGLEARARHGIPHVAGVSLDGGEIVDGDIVIDASGRRTQVGRWLDAIGARAPAYYEEPCNQLYFGRYYLRTTDEGLPEINNAFLSVFPLPWGAALMFPGDNGVMQFAIGTLPEDEELKSRLRNAEGFHAFVSSIPHIQDWVACGRPITDAAVMGNLNNYVRRLVVDGDPVVTGLHLVGDSASITNPQYGRGVSHAVVHASFVSSVLAAHPDDARAQSVLVDTEVGRMLEPSVQNSIRNDRLRTSSWRAALGGTEPPDGLTEFDRKMNVASMKFPEVWYAIVSTSLVLQPMRYWMQDETIMEKIHSVDPEAGGAGQAAHPSRDILIEAMDKAT